MKRSNSPVSSTAVYLHFPYCRSKCNYCDFWSLPLSQAPLSPADYLDFLGREIILRLKQFSDRPPLTSIYLGGGTPTLLPAGDLAGIIQSLVREFSANNEGPEITVEANPGTLSFSQVIELRQAGVNRVSLGVQSFDPGFLRDMGRCYQPEAIYRSYRLLRQAGIDNINLDLIYGLPGQGLSQWRDTLEEAVRLQPEHLSVYGLSLEPHSPWGKLQAQGLLQPADEDLAGEMYDMTRNGLRQAGYDHYEISNFARPGRECRHNCAYWLHQPYLGFGAGASSYWGGRRWTNCFSLEDYVGCLSRGQLPEREVTRLSPEEAMAETMMLGLRLTAGVDLEEFFRRYNCRAEEVYAREIGKLESQGLVETRGSFLALTDKGLPLGNLVFAEFI